MNNSFNKGRIVCLTQPLLPPRVIACRGSKESHRVFVVGLVSFMSLFPHVTLSFVLPTIPA